MSIEYSVNWKGESHYPIEPISTACFTWCSVGVIVVNNVGVIICRCSRLFVGCSNVKGFSSSGHTIYRSSRSSCTIHCSLFYCFYFVFVFHFFCFSFVSNCCCIANVFWGFVVVVVVGYLAAVGIIRIFMCVEERRGQIICVIRSSEEEDRCREFR